MRTKTIAAVAIAGLVAVGVWATTVEASNDQGRAPDPAPPAAMLKAAGNGTTAFPTAMENQPGVRHRSGGPYLSRKEVVEKVQSALGCSSSSHSCSDYKYSIHFFPRYEGAYERHTAKGWGYVAAFARDREVYFVTVRGPIPASERFRGADTNLPENFTLDHWNLIVDATTGEVMGQGTAGDPLIGDQ